ncbi:hypothetical protein EES44_24640 [Streptomyces sp. ADI96-15]|uniref:hypothetical protein n=1 Tax=Streptomyces TaxID=1883 RepID=UPI000F5563DE|nr:MULTISPECIES: hypothetical protein [Streptomyces]MDH6189196.1 hypothetical protein [Streptomyces sp. CZ24]RPK58124.1 hypothetical protein EES44_24640 [Streptomyces sp. ADI96-15]RWZ73353.1 hypothetical protein EQK42_24795 [Streptomyces albidoflavus]
MNPEFLPAIGASLRSLCEFAALHDVTDETLTELAAEIERARTAVAAARGAARANRCLQHPGSPVDPAAENGCLLCGPAQRRPARPIPEDFVPGDVLRHIEEHGQDAATARYGARAVTRALVLGGRHPSTSQLAAPAAELHNDEGDIDR